jgi:hypothetical protein
MAEYQLTANENTVLRRIDSAYIPDDPANRDRQEFDRWVADGGVPDPAPLPPEPPPPEPLTLPAEPTDDMHAATKGYVDTLYRDVLTEMRGGAPAQIPSR